jgi:hypothetical protein
VDPDALNATMRAALDGVLAAGGFRWNTANTHGGVTQVLWEAAPAEAAALVPDVAPWLGDPDGPCLDLWFTIEGGRITKASMEGPEVTWVLRETGHAAHADAIEAAGDFHAQVAAYAAAFGRLFGGGS